VSEIVRRAGRRDLEAIQSLWIAQREREAKLDPRLALAADADTIARDHRQVILADPRTVFLVAEEQGDVVAYLHAQVDSNDPTLDPPQYGTIVDLVVREDRRTAGLGDRLLYACKEWMQSHGLTELRISVPERDADARAFFEDREAVPLAITFVATL